jgi:hypothetical protein
MNPKAIEILLVEDNPGDVCLAQEALKEAKVRAPCGGRWDGGACLPAS